VIDYNNKIKQFPGVLVASIGGYSEKGYFEAAEGADKAPTVNF
jgi:LemA protein